MDIKHICTRKRREFGKPCTFVDFGPEILYEIDPNPSVKDDFVRLITADREIDSSIKMCAYEVNTDTFPTENRGINHMEGGWPASVDNQDEESMARFRKKIDKDKSYVNSVKSLCEFLEFFIQENNSIDIYEEYFESDRIKRETEWSITTKSVFQDLNENYRSVVDLSWERNSTKFAAAYALKRNCDYPLTPCLHSYVWDAEQNAKPLCILEPEIQITVVEFSPKDSNIILSGNISGQLALWDIRTSGSAQQVSPVFSSHMDKVTGIKWLHGKGNTRFFSSSTDGKLISWDSRNLSKPNEIINLSTANEDIPCLDQNYTVSCIEYDASVPGNFMVGTEQGTILSFRRRIREDNQKLFSNYNCESGLVLTIERNAFYPQLFMSCDAWSLKLWSENVSHTPVLNIISNYGYFTDVAWNPTRASTIYATKTTGNLEIWDIPGKSNEPLMNIKLENESLYSVAASQSGDLIVCGTLSGSIQLLNVPEHLKTCSELEKDLVRGCVKESPEIIGGCPRSERIIDIEETELSTMGVDENFWDPPEKAEDLYEEHKILFAGFPDKGEDN